MSTAACPQGCSIWQARWRGESYLWCFHAVRISPQGCAQVGRGGFSCPFPPRLESDLLQRLAFAELWCCLCVTLSPDNLQQLMSRYSWFGGSNRVRHHQKAGQELWSFSTDYKERLERLGLIKCLRIRWHESDPNIPLDRR